MVSTPPAAPGRTARYTIGIDQSTSGTKALLVDEHGSAIATNYQPVARYTPRPGWVEQDPTELWLATRRALHEAVLDARISPDQVEAIGIANQRETTVVWNVHTGEPVGRAISWQDRRTSSYCTETPAELRTALEADTGMTLVPNAAGPKIMWLLQNDPGVQRGMARGELLVGTVDAWIIWNLSGGAVHVSDHSNASVTMLMNARTLSYSELAFDAFEIPRDCLPDLRSSSEVYALTEPKQFFDARVPIAGCVGDQQAALLGQACGEAGMAKNTYGAGSFMILNVGERYIAPAAGAFSPVLWSVSGTVQYGLEGMTDESGGVLDWLRDGLGIIHMASDAELLARQVSDTGGLYFVPTLSDPLSPTRPQNGGGILMGLTHHSTKQHIARAALEAIAFQTRDTFEAIAEVAGIKPDVLRVDGGGAHNDFLMQFQADILGIPVERPHNLDTIPLGAAYLAGLAVGFWDSLPQVHRMWRRQQVFDPHFSEDRRETCYAGWREALSFTAQLGAPRNTKS